jgi:hypothetical protein
MREKALIFQLTLRTLGDVRMAKNEKQLFNCGEDGCDLQVEYEYTPVEGSDSLGSLRKAIYEIDLTCSKGHTHTYNVAAK